MKSNKKTTIMIQARTGSRRLPKKVLAKIEGKPLIWHVINRMKKVCGVEQIILVTTRKKEDEILLKIAKESQIIAFAGYVDDVLNRYYRCALLYDADPIIRITGDCPLIDAKIVEKMLRFYNTHNYDYVTNTIIPTYPDGLDVEIFSFVTLSRVVEKAHLKSDREHVVTYIKNNPEQFRIYNYKNKHDLSKLRWTVDQKSDLKLIRKIYSIMKPRTIFYYNDVLNIIAKDKSLSKINNEIMRNEGYLISLKKDYCN